MNEQVCTMTVFFFFFKRKEQYVESFNSPTKHAGKHTNLLVYFL